MSSTPVYASDIAFTNSVKAMQEKKGSRRSYARMEENGSWTTTITPDLATFIAEQTSVFLATANAEGQPYIQHRGGPAGFLRVLDDKTIAFVDYAGNRQYITAGNLADNPRAYLFLIDYAHRRRIKIWGTARVVDGDAELISKLMPDGYRARPEHVVLVTVSAWDANCPQHIPQRFEAADVAAALAERDSRIGRLEAEIRELKTAPTQFVEEAFSIGAAVDIDPVALSEYERYYHQLNPMNAALNRVPAGRTVLWRDLVSIPELKQTQFYNDYSHRHRMYCSVTSVLQRSADQVASLAIISNTPDKFDEDDAAFLSALSPHLMRAVEMNRRLHVVTAQRDSALAALDLLAAPVFLVDADCRLVHANPAGEALVGSGDGLTLEKGRLSADDKSDGESLNRLVLDAAQGQGMRGGQMIVQRPYPLRPLNLTVVPLPQHSDWLRGSRACAVVFVADPDARPAGAIAQLIAGFGLTHGEARMASALADGLSPEEAADRFGISKATARNQLNRALSKTSTNRQSELVRVILMSRPSVRD